MDERHRRPKPPVHFFLREIGTGPRAHATDGDNLVTHAHVRRQQTDGAPRNRVAARIEKARRTPRKTALRFAYICARAARKYGSACTTSGARLQVASSVASLHHRVMSSNGAGSLEQIRGSLLVLTLTR
jgi:hypothetical protein